jgi:hypothetical protein
MISCGHVTICDVGPHTSKLTQSASPSSDHVSKIARRRLTAPRRRRGARAGSRATDDGVGEEVEVDNAEADGGIGSLEGKVNEGKCSEKRWWGNLRG